MNVLVYGLGYVGIVTATCLAKLGNRVFGIESNKIKLNTILAGHSPIKEPYLEEILQETIKQNLFIPTSNGYRYVCNSKVSFICVGTPGNLDGSFRLDNIKKVAINISKGLKNCNEYHVVTLRSTVFPGTLRNIIGPLIEKYSKKKSE